jgi:hypothetical protein
MALCQPVRIDLPLKALVYEDAAGKTWLAYNAANTVMPAPRSRPSADRWSLFAANPLASVINPSVARRRCRWAKIVAERRPAAKRPLPDRSTGLRCRCRATSFDDRRTASQS